jgi:thymidylate synthase ThyX
MRVKSVSLAPTEAAQAAGRPALTPELLAATGARYSRNIEGLEAILARIDPDNQDASVDTIFRMLDYGHQSIADMVPVAMFIDGISMKLAYLIWAWSPQAGGQESSTRYIKLEPEGLVDPELLGIAAEYRSEWQETMQQAYRLYNEVETAWRVVAEENPELLRLPAELMGDSSLKAARQIERMRRNFAFDRSRYWLPSAAATNVMLVMSARAWAGLCQHLCSCNLPEAQAAGAAIREELALGAPRLLRHAAAKESLVSGLAEEFAALVALAASDVPETLRSGSAETAHRAGASLAVMAPAATGAADFAAALRYHDNRYAWQGAALKRSAVCFAWEAVAFGDIRDLNRHRTGNKYCPLRPLGFYAAADQLAVCHGKAGAVALAEKVAEGAAFGRDTSRRAHELLAAAEPVYIYWTLLGTQYSFEHVTTADKFIYEAELRTGLGAHYRYAQHLRDALEEWYKVAPETRGLVLEGDAEPE